MTPAPWRVGRKLGRTLYERKYTDQPSNEDRFLGIMDTPEDAKRVVDAVNRVAAHAGHGTPCETDPVNGSCGRPKLSATPDKARCTSCEHYMEFHQADGCWHAVVFGRQGKPVGCPCGVPVNRETDDA
ncbi:hypothetical protein NGM33_28540 [Nocardiopsis dassonvillei]|uniref:hypothetical protein n=1 Tax=Nocardiopsis dassonvillei TaxID=2014 RepID=UPI0020A29946|nr:hypothetical protein [Nocardiopsis dassonvillei]MCP3017285.1 hypothetical protein [Nocardiopsis dassonvillei]